MENEDVNSFLNDKLKNKKIVEKSFDHTIRYFKFPQKGKRNINKVRYFLLNIGVPLNFISNINLINEDILELAFINDINR